MKNNPVAKLKERQDQMLQLLVYFRCVNRKQFQYLLGHKDEENIRTWLNELVEKKYVASFFTRTFGSEPTHFCLDSKCIPYFRMYHFDEVDTKSMNWIYREKNLSSSFHTHCMRVVDLYLSLKKLTKERRTTLSFKTKRQLRTVKYLPLPLPDAYFAITEKDKRIKRYFLEVFDSVVLGEDIKDRVKQYFFYYRKRYWQKNSKKPFPEIILVLPNQKLKHITNGFILSKMRYQDSPPFYLTTLSDIHEQGINKNILQKVEL